MIFRFYLTALIIIILSCNMIYALEKSSKAPFKGHETFDDVKPERFSSFPVKNTSIRNGVLWTRGESGRKYPPTVRAPIAEKDCTISFRYRHLGDGKSILLFINGDDGFGGFDHMLRVKLLRNAITIQVDAHTKDPKNPNLLKLPKKQQERKPDKVSGAFRVPERLASHKLDLNDNKWHELKLVFKKNTVSISLDDELYTKQVTRPGFGFEKQEISWMQDGGDKGIEIDDLKVISN
jgi:hypothetical protein